MPDLSSCLMRRWVHSWEEDSGAIRTYRPEGSSLPLSRRPRQIIEFGEDSRFISRGAGPADARVSREGGWELSEAGVLTLRWDDEGKQATSQIVECTEEVLQVRMLSGSIE
jgi:hypothetical protein